MGKAFFAGIVLAWASGLSSAADLSPTEWRWLRGSWPVVAYAKAAGMPLDVIVQPQPTPGLPPLALAFIEGRCKLVLSMRGNPEAEATLARIEPELLAPTLELMAAHELGHCRRYLDGAWHGVPAGFASGVPAGLSDERREAWENMTAARREEGYGDLVGLAWTAERHPRHYGRLHAWLVAERSRERVPGSPHDTLAWVRLAADRAAWRGGSLFAGPALLWRAGLAADD
ncbi:MAG: hypothetical protein ABIQ06_05550 [Caldimonas sp.]